VSLGIQAILAGYIDVTAVSLFSPTDQFGIEGFVRFLEGCRGNHKNPPNCKNYWHPLIENYFPLPIILYFSSLA
jgi:hypothetical protein